MHLRGEFACRCQHQYFRVAFFAAGVFVLQQLQQGQGEACRFTGASLGAGQQILAFEHKRYRLLLYWSGFAVALFFYCA